MSTYYNRGTCYPNNPEPVPPITAFDDPAEIITIDGQTYRRDHVATARGYVSRVGDPAGFVEAYSGKFGVGYKTHEPLYRTSRYHLVTYYIAC